jgi:putative glutamine amidotransferase
MPPLIGLTTSRSVSSFGLPSQSVAEAYIKSISAAGAVPLLIPLGLSEAHLEAVAARLDGILFTGGGDIHPERYHAPGHPKVNFVDEDRDRVEMHLVQQAVQHGMPFLGICRGLQVINVALGGTLYEDIQDQHPSAMKHNYTNQEGRDFLAHRVELDPHSRLSAILGLTETPVNSLHHQAVRRLANGLRPAAFAPDGILEGFELPTHPFGLAVQWHPEWLQGHLAMRSLFQAFVQASELQSQPLKDASASQH